jgi:hypothetical protein
MFRYGLRSRQKAPSQRPAVIAVGTNAAPMEANEVELGVYAPVRQQSQNEMRDNVLRRLSRWIL